MRIPPLIAEATTSRQHTAVRSRRPTRPAWPVLDASRAVGVVARLPTGRREGFLAGSPTTSARCASGTGAPSSPANARRGRASATRIEWRAETCPCRNAGRASCATSLADIALIDWTFFFPPGR